jgi:hypothetical protein
MAIVLITGRTIAGASVRVDVESRERTMRQTPGWRD